MDKLIISEGKGDEAFFKHLLETHGLSGFKILPRLKGIAPGNVFDKMLRAIRTASEHHNVKLVVIVADCDSEPERAFRKVAKQIRRAKGYAIPDKPREVANGTDVVSTSVLMLPWDDEQGALETVCFKVASRRRRKIGKCVRTFVECVGAAEWKPSQLSKLQLRCLMAASCKGDPNTGLQFAWSPQWGRRPKDLIPLDMNHLSLDRIVEYLASLP